MRMGSSGDSTPSGQVLGAETAGLIDSQVTSAATDASTAGERMRLGSRVIQRCRKVTGGYNMVKAHDYFNLTFIAVLNFMNFYYLATGNGFDAFFLTTVSYFLLDMLFVGIWPRCVKSPIVIMGHHVITSLYILIPLHYPAYQWCMSYCMLVEINTWLLIARRTFTSVRIFSLLFYISWVLLRNIFYPILIYMFYKEWQHETLKCGSPWNPIVITPIFQTFLTGLNYYWSLELVVRKIKQL